MPEIRELIPDSGLYLGAIDQLLNLGEITLEDLQTVLDVGITTIRSIDDFWYEEDGARHLNIEECQDEILTAIVEAVGGFEVNEVQLGQVTSLHFGGGNPVYVWIEAATAESLGLEAWELHTGGESDLYVVRSFDGILALPNLEILDLDSYGWTDAPRDASDLLRCQSLKTVQQSMSLDLDTKTALIAAGVDVS